MAKLEAMTSDMYSIKDLELLSGIKAHTIRIWEKRYGIIHPGRTDTNIRFYTNEDLRKLLNISLLNQHGYKISAISNMSEKEIGEKIAAVSIVSQTDTYLESLLLSLIEMDELRFNKTFTAIVISHGFEKSFIKYIFPFFQRIGIMWQIGAINPAQEHFLSNLIRNKIIAATETVTQPPDPTLGTALLFLPENELHEIGLLFYNYALRARGFKTFYLGQSVPYDGLDRVIAICKPSFIITSLTNPLSNEDTLLYCQNLCALAPEVNIYFTGPMPENIHDKLPKNALLVNDLIALMKI